MANMSFGGIANPIQKNHSVSNFGCATWYDIDHLVSHWKGLMLVMQHPRSLQTALMTLRKPISWNKGRTTVTCFYLSTFFAVPNAREYFGFHAWFCRAQWYAQIDALWNHFNLASRLGFLSMSSFRPTLSVAWGSRTKRRESDPIA